MSDVDPLPERTRLFHVGIPKSGTTSLQMAATTGREALRRHGVLYPGSDVNQRTAVLGFMGRRWGWTSDAVPPREDWDEMMAEIEGDARRRVLFGHEFASESDVKTAGRFVDAIGERCHIAITLRSPGSILPSAWQQYVKAGVPIAFDEWLGAVIADPPDRSVTRGFHDRNNQAGVVRTWAEAAGADRVTVVVLDKRRPELLFNTFEQLLALPSGTLAAQELDGFASNRGLTVPESELFLALNACIREQDVQWNEFERIIRNGAQRRVMEQRDADEDRPQLPPWAVRRASELGALYAEAIAASGVHVVGDLDQLAEQVTPRDHEGPPSTLIPVDLAAEAMAGMMSAATWRGAFFGETDAKAAERDKAKRGAYIVRAAQRFSTRDLLRFGGLFIVARLRQALHKLERFRPGR